VGEFLNHSVATPDGLEGRLGVRCLGFVPRARCHEIQAPGPDRGTVGEWTVPAPVKESYEVLAEHVVQAAEDSGTALVLGVTSARRKEGVSIVASNLACELGSRTHRVLLIDANLDHSVLHRVLRVERSPGLADLLATGQSDVQTLQPCAVPNVDVLSSGVSSADVSVAFDEEAFAEILAAVKGAYYAVIVDLPAVAETAVAARLSALCDRTVLVVEADRERWEVLRGAEKQLGIAGATLLGAVLNQRRFPIPGWLYRTL
jgi:capsular exopolysaccharide synthesis family protein